MTRILISIFVFLSVNLVDVVSVQAFEDCIPNQKVKSFRSAKTALKKLYSEKINEELYCGMLFDKDGVVIDNKGYTTEKYNNAELDIDWEHAVPAEFFGQSFKSWREGDLVCKNKDGDYKGRECASKANPEFDQMEGDLYNLFPAWAPANRSRQNYKYGMVNHGESPFGGCDFKMEENESSEKRKDNYIVQPRIEVRGQLARASLYMACAYPLYYRMSDQQRKLFEAWDRMYPVTDRERRIAAKIKKIQGNPNPYIEGR